MWEDASTVAFGITVPKALGDFLILDAIYKTDGCAIAVDDDDLLDAQGVVARNDGAFICPEGAACFAAARSLRASGWLSESDEVLIINTGTGIKYPDTVSVSPPVLQVGDTIPVG
jgi:threonine synthase